MKSLFTFLIFCSLAHGQMLQSISNDVKHAGGGGGTMAYTGQNCTGGGGSSGTSTCTATFTVSTGDEVAVFGTVGTITGPTTLSSCSTATGSASVSWSVVSSTTQNQGTNVETSAMCVGAVISGGIVEPRMTWSATGSDNSIVAAGFSGSTTNTTDGSNSNSDTVGTTATNGVISGNITTTVNGDMIVGGVADTGGSAATITAGTTSLSFTKIVCTTVWGGQTCMQYARQITAGASTAANWTFSLADDNVAAVVALKP